MVETIIGEAVAGEAAKVRAQLDAAIALTRSSVFDVMELLWKVKKDKLYVGYGFTTMQEFYESLTLKPRRSQYLLRVAEVMDAMGYVRAQYEHMAQTALREICRLDPAGTYKNPVTGEETPMKEFIAAFIADHNLDLDKVKENVRILLGQVGDNDRAWLNLPFTRLVLRETVSPAIEKMKQELGSTAKTAEGIAIDASDSYALEMILADYLGSKDEG